MYKYYVSFSLSQSPALINIFCFLFRFFTQNEWLLLVSMQCVVIQEDRWTPPHQLDLDITEHRVIR